MPTYTYYLCTNGHRGHECLSENDQPHRTLSNLGRVSLVRPVDDSILSRFGVSGKAGAVQ